MLMLALAAGACSSAPDDAGSEQERPQAPGSTLAAGEVRVVGRDLRFDVNTLSIPAGTPFAIVFDNRDEAVPHNLALYRSGPPAADRVAMSPIAPGPTTQRLEVGSLAAGRYFYQCDVHPTTMTGTLVAT